MQLVMPFARPVSYAPEDYLRGAANESALNLIERWPDWPYSVVFLYGPKGSGKTHLAHVFAARARATMLAPERIGTAPADEILVGNHAWVIDDISRVVDPMALAQLLNHVRARGDYVLLTAPDSPAHLRVALPDLHSRLMALPTVALGEPDDALLMGVLAKQFSDRQLRIAPEVLRFAVSQIERSFSAMQHLARVLDTRSLERGRAVTVSLVRETVQNPGWQTS